MGGLDRSAVSRIVQNTKISEMNNLRSQGRDMDYIDLLKASGWQLRHIVDCPLTPLPTQRFLPNMVSRIASKIGDAMRGCISLFIFGDTATGLRFELPGSEMGGIL